MNTYKFLLTSYRLAKPSKRTNEHDDGGIQEDSRLSRLILRRSFGSRYYKLNGLDFHLFVSFGSMFLFLSSKRRYPSLHQCCQFFGERTTQHWIEWGGEIINGFINWSNNVHYRKRSDNFKEGRAWTKKYKEKQYFCLERGHWQKLNVSNKKKNYWIQKPKLERPLPRYGRKEYIKRDS